MNRIRIIAFDVDGTLTLGMLMIGPGGEVCKVFSARDGLGLSLAHRMGYITGLITGRASESVAYRQKELHMDFAEMNVTDKIAAMEAVRKHYGVAWEEIAYMGDDLNDLALMKKVGYSGCPADGADEVRQAADFLSEKNGGAGAARAFIESILKREGRWDEAVQSYLTGPQAAGQ